MSIRVLFVLDGPYPLGGASTSRIQKLASGMRDAGAEAYVLARRDPIGGAESDRWQQDHTGVPYFLICPPRRSGGLPGKASEYLSLPVLFRRAAQRIIEEKGIQAVVVYGHSWFTMNAVHRLCRRRGIANLRDVTEWFPRASFVRHPLMWVLSWDIDMFRRVLVPTLDGVVAISRLWEEHSRKLGIPAIRVPAIGDNKPVAAESDETPPPVTNKQFIVTYLGQMSGRDLPYDMIEGVRLAAAKGVDAQLVVIGNVEIQDVGRQVMQYVQHDPELRRRVTFTGYITHEEVRRRLTTTDALVLLRPDSWETQACFPTRLPEYLLTGKPVILSDAGDMPLYFQHGKNAWLIHSGPPTWEKSPAADAMAEAIFSLASDARQAREIGQAGMKTALEEFAYPVHARRMIAFLEDLVSGKLVSARRAKSGQASAPQQGAPT